MPSTPDATAPPSLRPRPLARVRSWLLDWLVVGAWLGVLAVVGLAARPLLPSGEAGATTLRALLTADVLITVATVLPYLLYLVLTESSPRRATLGKRWAGLRVAAADGSSPVTGSVWVRNLIKVLAWQLGHLGFTRGMLETQVGLGIGLAVAGTLLGLACAVPALVGGRGIHDRIAGTRVERGAATARRSGS
ncbi:RDD family protein [Ornithinimicrobium pratense]|uniref:RDD family protein n=1 Tax=Ornithinimicrobium pratense TaxID=2593973 RepID=A0A5J6V4T3_9MICO|nr:RDD family protein [Ornithinimicrobium pratense]QFG68959.1 RDD family protein [Ornithinimicrobium pratense]